MCTLGDACAVRHWGFESARPPRSKKRQQCRKLKVKNFNVQPGFNKRGCKTQPVRILPLLQSLLALIGVIVGWFLKSGTDFLTASHRERVTRRKCTFLSPPLQFRELPDRSFRVGSEQSKGNLMPGPVKLGSRFRNAQVILHFPFVVSALRGHLWSNERTIHLENDAS